jgi:hypothetical protein
MEYALPISHNGVSKPEEDPSLNQNSKYKEIISGLPRRDDWNFQPLYNYKGFWEAPVVIESLLSAEDNSDVQPSDVVIASFPKSGTTWLKALGYAIATRSRVQSQSLLLKKLPHECVTFLEFNAMKTTNRDPELPLLSTHIPYTCMPKSVLDSGCKIVYICRDPKDVLISLWQFLKNLPGSDVNYVSLQEAFDLFCQGVCVEGPYWDHVLGYWNTSLESPDKVLFLKYEDLKKETVSCVKKMAEFMGYPFTMEEEQQGVVQKIIDMCSFKNLSNLEVNKSAEYLPNTNLASKNSNFFRKGESGDWKNHLTAEMGAHLDQITELKLSGSGLTFTSAVDA